MDRPAIYLASVAGSTRKLLSDMGCPTPNELIARVQAAVGERFSIEGDSPLIEAPEDDDHGGRSDDAERAAAITRVFRDDRFAALVALRGGAWLTRILDRIDFAVLAQRRSPIALFGFSELTTLLNVAAGYRSALCVHGLGPAFLLAGLRRFAKLHPDELAPEQVHARFVREFFAFFDEVVRILDEQTPTWRVTGQLVSGELPAECAVRFVGGNLAVLVTLLGTPFHDAVDPAGRWLLLEDVNEKPERVDRRLAQLKLAGILQRCAGLLVGDFHEDDRDHQPAVLELLPYHLPTGKSVPVVITGDIGHVWPMSPIPLNRTVTLKADPSTGRVELRWTGQWIARTAGQM